MRRAETGKGRDEVDAVVRAERGGERLVSAASEITPRPSRSHCTAAPVTKTEASSAYAVRPSSPQATVASRPSPGAGAASPALSRTKLPVPYVFLACPGRVACLAEERRLLVARDARDRDVAAELAGATVDLRRRDRLRQARRVDAEQLAQLAVPARAFRCRKHRPRRVRDVAHVAARQLEDEPGVDRAEDRVLRGVDVAQQPLDLRSREVWVDHEPGALADELRVARLAQLLAALGGAPVLPDERVVDRLARLWIPGDDGLALVGDPNRGEPGAGGSRVADRLRGDAAGHAPDLVRVVLDPAGPREVLAELAVGAAGDPPSRSKTRQVVPVVPWSIARIMRAQAIGWGKDPRGWTPRSFARRSHGCGRPSD